MKKTNLKFLITCIFWIIIFSIIIWSIVGFFKQKNEKDNAYIYQMNVAFDDGNYKKMKKIAKGRDLNRVYLSKTIECDQSDEDEVYFDRACLTPLEMVSSNQTDDVTGILQFLLDNGAEIDFIDPMSGQSALFYAVEALNIKTVAFLINKGASLNITISGGRTPIEHLTRQYIPKSKEYNDKREKKFQIFKLLLENNDNQKNNQEFLENLLLLSIENNSDDIGKYLIENYNVNINKIYTKENNRTLLIISVIEGNIKMVKTLLDNNADKSIKDIDGKTALDYAKDLHSYKSEYYLTR